MFFGKTKHSAGKRVKSQIRAVPIIAADNSPNWKEGRKAESKRHKNPDTKTVVVIIKAAPVFMIVFLIAFFLDKPFESSLLKRNKKWRESSTAIPSATEKVKAVGTRSGISNQASIPIIVNIGIKFDKRLANKIDFDLNIQARIILIRISAMLKLFASALSSYLFVFSATNVVPV